MSDGQHIALVESHIPLDVLLARMDAGAHPPQSLGLPRAARLPVVAALHARLNRTLLLITDRSDHAQVLLEELGLWAPEANVMSFAAPNGLFYERTPWSENTRRERLQVLSHLAAAQVPGAPRPENVPIIVASAHALMTRTLPRRAFVKAMRILRAGQRLEPHTLSQHLVTLGYEPVSIVTQPGQFSRRGGLLDLWPMLAQSPVRLDFFGDELDTLRPFDPATQRTTGRQDRLLIPPAREFLLPSTWEEDEPPEEFHIPFLHPENTSLLDYLPPDALVLLDDQQALEDAFNELETQAAALRNEAIQSGSLPPDFPLPYISWDEMRPALKRRNALALGPYGQPPDAGLESLRAAFSPNPRFGGQIKTLLEYLPGLLQRGDQVLIVSRQATRLQEVWDEYMPSGSLETAHSAPVFLAGSLSDGWILTPTHGARVHLFSDGEIFGWQRPQPRRPTQPKASAPESTYADLGVGDWVVHVEHGIGLYRGMVRRTIEGLENEYLLIEYADGDELYVPVHQADRLTRYVGADGRRPSPSRLGSAEWQHIRQRVSEAVQQVAEDLLELYARRQIATGFAFNPDSHWQQELEASFPYIETPDQLQVLAEVKRDMERPQPMDRLICGDVGYGKTEIALRAAFKAVMDGKQVLLLVPTTVLAQQHYNTFRQRLAPFPVRVEMLSRFRSPREQRTILNDLKHGRIDIVIGTHRLLSDDVHLKDLGLLIIDEEQRFGVAHKEKIKRMRAEVDVLTLTATPIPRTLYMALAGVRDISTLNTPPAERLPVITHVGPYNKHLVRQAILRELDRGGQIFFVHNRVKTIHAMQAHLQSLAPAARIDIGHGQMPEKDLAEVMRKFSNGEIDILLSTSIIESGLDIPSANTLIVDRADTFGLAQLYQLRGRVGRGGQRAYAYFFRHRKLLPTPEGQLRLETIAENSQLGAGFAIAMRDLEIRGAGDLLGTRQHGHIAAVGLHLYTRLLAEAVRRLQKHAPEKSPLPAALGFAADTNPGVNVDLPMSISIPPGYVPDQVMRLSLYRRLADLRTPEDIASLRAEFDDRFGPLPAPVENLLYQVQVRLLAEQAGLSAVTTEGGMITLRYGDAPPIETALGERVRHGRTALWFDYKAESDWRSRLIEILTQLAQLNPA
ncbi:MAG: transcription-repair coupling factor [Anaerolineales bacterium]